MFRFEEVTQHQGALLGMATITGTNGRNILHGTNLADTISGLGGSDDLYGAAAGADHPLRR